MPAPSLISVTEDFTTRRAAPLGAYVSRLAQMVVTVVVLALPAFYVLSVLALTVAMMWHVHLLMGSLLGIGWSTDWALIIAAVVGEVVGVLLMLRQLMPRAEPPMAAVALMRVDQDELFDAITMVATKLGSPMPSEILGDASVPYRTEQASFSQLLSGGRGLRLRIGMSGTVGLTGAQFLGLVAHELAIYSPGCGARSGWLIRRVHRWFDLRIQCDPWLRALKQIRAEGARFTKLWASLAWMAVWLSLQPLQLLYALCRLISSGRLHSLVNNADLTAANLVGSEVMATALEHQALVQAHADALYADLREGKTNDRLPDSLPALIARLLMVQSPAEIDLDATSHWMPMAPPDKARIANIRRHNATGMVKAEADATLLFRNFNEYARQVTYFMYQNDWGVEVHQQRLVASEEMAHQKRTSRDTVTMLARYFKGLAHPERAFCGIAEDTTAATDPELLKLELEDCREWLEQFGERMAGALEEWTKTWQMVRDLEMAHLQLRAGLAVHRQQYAVGGDRPDAYREEIDRQRHVMDSLEGVLRQFEAKLEIRLSAALDLLWRADASALPERMVTARATLPHWMLIYEGLGMQLPLLRELMTKFSAFQALGATVASVVDSAQYYTALQTAIPEITQLMREVLRCISDTIYPFKTNWTGNERLTLAVYLTPPNTRAELELLEKGFTGSADRRIQAQQHSKRLSHLVAPFIDRYLMLYHQSFGWLAKCADMAEWHFSPPTQHKEQPGAAAMPASAAQGAAQPKAKPSPTGSGFSPPPMGRAADPITAPIPMPPPAKAQVFVDPELEYAGAA